MINPPDVKILIEDVVVPTKGIGKYFFIKTVDHVILGNPPTFYWEVRAQVIVPGTELDEQVLKYPGESLLQGNLTMSTDEYAQWSTDDNYIINWALEKLNFTKI